MRILTLVQEKLDPLFVWILFCFYLKYDNWHSNWGNFQFALLGPLCLFVGFYWRGAYNDRNRVSVKHFPPNWLAFVFFCSVISVFKISKMVCSFFVDLSSTLGMPLAVDLYGFGIHCSCKAHSCWVWTEYRCLNWWPLCLLLQIPAFTWWGGTRAEQEWERE